MYASFCEQQETKDGEEQACICSCTRQTSFSDDDDFLQRLVQASEVLLQLRRQSTLGMAARAQLEMTADGAMAQPDGVALQEE